jgi:adenylate cyclase
MPIPLRLSPRHPLRKVIAAALIAALATALGFAAHHTPGVKVAMSALDDTLYDAFYHFRKPVDRKNTPIVIVTADDESKDTLAKKKIRWPYPRILWGSAVQYMEKCGAKAVVFDVIFEEPSNFDAEFGKQLDSAKIPVVMGAIIQPTGQPDSFAPKVKRPPIFGAVNILDDTVVRDYKSDVFGVPSLALRAVQVTGGTIPSWADRPFRLHYYGPTNVPAGDHVDHTYRYVHAWSVFTAAQQPARAAEVHADPSLFKDKIVLMGATMAGAYDQKSSPVSKIYPGVEVQATAIDNLLNGQFVEPVDATQSSVITFVIALIAAIGVVIPRKASIKVIFAAIAAGALIAVAIIWFTGFNIHWLAMSSPLLALLFAIVGGFAFTYFAEDRDRRLVLKALTQYLSPDVAAEIERNPASLKLGGQRRDMTVMFTDIQGFTDLSESMESEKLSELLNFYLGEMSAIILAHNGTLDKYIGDAIMSFWNAPIVQADHAARACRAALAMQKREAEIQRDLASMGAPNLLTRIGINSGPMVFGNMGAPQKFNYSVLGDSVNLGSRLEGANKFYGSRILISESTAALLNGKFLIRQLDLLRVKGKLKPVSVFELLSEGKEDASLVDRAAKYDQAFKLYVQQKWDAALDILTQAHQQYPGDGPVSALIKRAEKLHHDPPAADWDGVYVAKDK